MGTTKLSLSPLKGHERNTSKNNMPDWSRPGSTMTLQPTAWLQGGGNKCATGANIAIRLLKERTTIGTWNICSLHACGKVQELTHELKCYWWDILGLADVRWTSFGETNHGWGTQYRYCREDSKQQYGVAVIVQREVAGSSIGCTPISSRLISIRISARPHNITVIQIFAPTPDHEDEEVKHFWEQPDSIIAQTPKKHMLAIQGDWNAKVCAHTYQHWAGTVGKSGIGEANDRGWRLLEFAKRYWLCLANTLYPTSCLGQQPGIPLVGRSTTR